MIVARSLNFSDPAQNPPVVEGQANPIRRDVYQIPSGQSITLRVVADNPGAWFLHCKFLKYFFFSLDGTPRCKRLSFHVYKKNSFFFLFLTVYFFFFFSRYRSH